MASTGIFPNETSIYIVPSGTVGSALASSDKIVGDVTNVKITGLEQSKDAVNVIGGQVDKRTPRTPGEISFDVIVNNTSAATFARWDLLRFATGLSSDISADKAVFLQFLSNSIYDTMAINNAAVTVGDTEMAADDMLKKSVTLKFMAVTPLGVANLKTSALAASSNFFNWS